MLIGERLQAIRKAKKVSQGDIEKRSGLFRSYTSRVENGQTVPSVETLERLAPVRHRAGEQELVVKVFHSPNKGGKTILRPLSCVFLKEDVFEMIALEATASTARKPLVTQ